MKTLSIGIVFLLLGIAGPANGSEPADAPAADEWIIVLKDSRSDRRRGWSSGVGYSGSYNYADDPQLRRLAKGVADDYELSVTRQWPIRALKVHCVVVRLDADRKDVLDALRKDRRVEWVQPLQEFEGLGAPDPYRHLQRSLEIMNVAPLHASFSGDGVRIAMIDSGVESDHPDIAHALTSNVDFVGRDHDGERHGTGIAGVLVAANSNGVGISGVAPSAELHAYRACWESADGDTRCNSLTLSLALDHALTIRPHIVNLSLTGPQDRLLDALVAMLVGNGALVVTANDPRRGSDRFPSARSGVLIVHDGTGVAEPEGDALYAPGGAVLTAQPGHSYDYMAGSSLSAAHVSGVLALLLEARPDMAPATTQAKLAASVRATDDTSSIDACEALACERSVDTCASCVSEAGN